MLSSICSVGVAVLVWLIYFCNVKASPVTTYTAAADDAIGRDVFSVVF